MDNILHNMYCGFIDRFLVNASPIYSIVYLYALRFASDNQEIPTISEQATALKQLPSDINSAWLYWVSQGLASIDGENISLTLFVRNNKSITVADESIRKAKKEKIVDIKELKKEREKESLPNKEMVAWVIEEAEKAFDNNMSSRDIETLNWILTDLCLPPDVVIPLINYARSGDKKKPMSYIEKVAIDWKDRKINNALKAEEFIKSMQTKKRSPKRGKKSAFNNFENRDYKEVGSVHEKLLDSMFE